MLAQPPASDKTFHHVVEQPTLRRVVEHFTLFTLLLAVSLYAIGQFQSWKYIQCFGIPTTGLERGWETHVFTGAVAVINLLTNYGVFSLRWVIPLGLFLGCLTALNRLPEAGSGFRHRAMKAILTTFVGASYVLLLLMLGVTWGIENARMVQSSSDAGRTRYVLVPEAESKLPRGFVDANARS